MRISEYHPQCQEIRSYLDLTKELWWLIIYLIKTFLS